MRRQQDNHLGKSADPLGVSEGGLSSNFMSNVHIRNTDVDTLVDNAHYEELVCQTFQPDKENVTQQEVVSST